MTLTAPVVGFTNASAGDGCGWFVHDRESGFPVHRAVHGAVPVVARVGGLADTVIDAESGADHGRSSRTRPTGFTFEKYDARAFWKAVDRALRTYRRDKPLWREMQSNGMKKDFSWDRSAARYADVYEKILAVPRAARKHS